LPCRPPRIPFLLSFTRHIEVYTADRRFSKPLLQLPWSRFLFTGRHLYARIFAPPKFPEASSFPANSSRSPRVAARINNLDPVHLLPVTPSSPQFTLPSPEPSFSPPPIPDVPPNIPHCVIAGPIPIAAGVFFCSKETVPHPSPSSRH